MVKPLHLGNAARNGIIAAELSLMGFTANPEILDHHGGFFGALTAAETREKLRQELQVLAARNRFQSLPMSLQLATRGRRDYQDCGTP